MMRHVALALTLGMLAAIGCAGENTLEPCDVRRSDCQQQVFLAVADARGSSWDPWFPLPTMRVVTEEQYCAELLAQAPSGPATPGGPNQPDDLTSALKLLHLLDPNETREEGACHNAVFAAAYYVPARQLVTVIDRGGETDQCGDVRTLAHELVHAAQDRDLHFKTLNRGVDSFDEQQVVDALLEGEGVLYETLIDAKLREQGRCGATPPIDLAQVLGATRDNVVDLTRFPSPFRTATALLGYPLGARYLGYGYEAAGSLGVRRAFEPRPEGDVRLMNEQHSEYDRPLPAWSCATLNAPEGYRASVFASFGGFVAYAFATLVLTPEPAAWDNALASAGDDFVVYSNAAHEVLVEWSLHFRSEQRAEELGRALAESPLGASIEHSLQGDVLQVRASSQPHAFGDRAWASCSE